MATYDVNRGSGELVDAHPDDDLRARMDEQVHEAAERLAFHQQEVERWGRIGRAAGAALAEIHALGPVPEASVEQFLQGSVKSTGMTSGGGVSVYHNG